MEEELTTLCGSCGLCCDGSLFGRVVLEPDEVESARRKRLPVIANGTALDQPCTALAQDGSHGRRACSIYEERPRACRRFACRLYERHRREGGPLAPRLEAVQRVRALVAYLEASGLTPADFDDERWANEPRAAEGERARDAFHELTRHLEEDFARA